MKSKIQICVNIYNEFDFAEAMRSNCCIKSVSCFTDTIQNPNERHHQTVTKLIMFRSPLPLSKVVSSLAKLGMKK